MQVHVSVRMELLDSQWADFHEIWYLGIFLNPWRKFRYHWNLTSVTCSLHEDSSMFRIIYRLILIWIRNISDKNYRENQNTFYLQKFFSENHVVYEITHKNSFEADRPQMTMYTVQKNVFCMTDNKNKNIHTHRQNISHLLLFYGYNGYANASQCNVKRTLSCFYQEC
jgi:hypothetical protein